MAKINIIVLFFIIILGFSSCIDNTSFWESYNGNIDSTTACTNASKSLLEAKNKYEAAVAADDSVSETCIYYRAAIQNYVSQCSDSSSYYTNLLTELGDCAPEETGNCDDVIATVNAAAAAFNALTPSDPTYANICQAYKVALQAQITICGDPNGTIQTTIDGLNCN